MKHSGSRFRKTQLPNYQRIADAYHAHTFIRVSRLCPTFPMLIAPRVHLPSLQPHLPRLHGKAIGLCRRRKHRMMLFRGTFARISCLEFCVYTIRSPYIS